MYARWWVAAGAAAAACAVAVAGGALASGAGNPAAASMQECRGGRLAISFVHHGAVMGQEGGLLRFTNVAVAPCRISGYPRVVAVAPNGRTVRASRSLQSMLFATFWQHIPPVPKVTLQHGGSGYAGLGGADNPAAAGRENPNWRCPAARRLLVSPPGSRRRVALSGHLWRSGANQIYLPMCGGRPWVEPIRPRPHFFQ